MSNILVVGPSWVGDMVMAQSLFQVLRNQQPECSITVLAPSWSVPVLARMPQVDANVEIPVGHGKLGLADRWRLGRQLRGRYDQAIVLPGSFKSALVPWLAGIKRRTGFIGEQRYGLLNDIRRLDPASLPLNVQRFVALALESDSKPMGLDQIPLPQLKVEKENSASASEKFGLESGSPLLALCPGAEYGPAKQWPPEHFSEVAAVCISRGWQVMIMGSEKDRKIAAEISNTASGCLDLTGRTSLGDAIDLMSLASQVVTNDSGLMHVAAAVGCHVIALYGSSTDTFTPPLTKHTHKLSLDLPCRPCFKRICPLHHLDCLKKLKPGEVISILETNTRN